MGKRKKSLVGWIEQEDLDRFKWYPREISLMQRFYRFKTEHNFYKPVKVKLTIEEID